MAFSFDRFMRGLASGSDTGLAGIAKPYVESKTKEAYKTGLSDIQKGDWESGISAISEWNPELALNIAQNKQAADNEYALQQMKINAEKEKRETMTPYQEAMLALQREKLNAGIGEGLTPYQEAMIELQYKKMEAEKEKRENLTPYQERQLALQQAKIDAAKEAKTSLTPYQEQQLELQKDIANIRKENLAFQQKKLEDAINSRKEMTPYQEAMIDLQQKKIQSANDARNTMTPYQEKQIELQQAKLNKAGELSPYQEAMLALQRDKLKQVDNAPFSSKNEFINLMGIRNNQDVWESLPDDQKALVNARLNFLSNSPESAYDVSYQKGRGKAQADIETRGDIAYQGQLGKDRAILEKENTALERNLPAFEEMTNELIDLADKATYTQAGQARDWILRQTGQPMSEGGIAREKYRQVVANELIPKLKQMFGGQLSDSERESLLATLGDVNLAPEEKKSAINAFIEAKRRQVKYNQPQTSKTDYKSKYGLE